MVRHLYSYVLMVKVPVVVFVSQRKRHYYMAELCIAQVLNILQYTHTNQYEQLVKHRFHDQLITVIPYNL